MNEREFLNNILPMLRQGDDIIVGPGDDCAVININDANRYLLFATDQLISDVHYDYKRTTPEEAGAKLIKRNISDIAAMGGVPAHAVVNVAVRQGTDQERILRFYKGLSAEADKWGVSVCGGDIAKLGKHRLEVYSLSITGYAGKQKLCLRSNAEPGDLVYVTGCFGDSYSSGHHLTFVPRVKEAQFLAGAFSNTMMDVSDGLLIDLKRISEASNVTISLDTGQIPGRTNGVKLENILTDGEDYELIFTVKPERVKKLEDVWPFKDVKITEIGRILPFNGKRIVDAHSNRDLLSELNIGWDHFGINY